MLLSKNAVLQCFTYNGYYSQELIFFAKDLDESDGFCTSKSMLVSGESSLVPRSEPTMSRMS